MAKTENHLATPNEFYAFDCVCFHVCAMLRRFLKLHCAPAQLNRITHSQTHAHTHTHSARADTHTRSTHTHNPNTPVLCCVPCPQLFPFNGMMLCCGMLDVAARQSLRTLCFIQKFPRNVAAGATCDVQLSESHTWRYTCRYNYMHTQVNIVY